jgi:small-conductance mechanosensitive channel
VIGTGGSLALARQATVTDRIGIAGDFLTLISALLGVVLAAFALVVAFLSDSYTLQLQKNPKGVRAFFAPFMINVGVDVGLVVGSVAYRAAALHLPGKIEKAFFVVIATLFVYAALNITALARAVMAHGVTRAELIEMDQLEKELDSGRKE